MAMAQRFYEAGVGSRTGMRPDAIPADPAAMRNQMESLFRKRHVLSTDRQSVSAQNSSTSRAAPSSAMNTTQSSDSPSNAVQRSIQRHRQALDWVESAGSDGGDMPAQEYADDDSASNSDEDENDEGEEEEEDEEPPPTRRRQPASNARPASLFASNPSASGSKRRRTQPANYSWMADVEESDEGQEGSEVEKSVSAQKRTSRAALSPPSASRPSRPHPRPAKANKPGPASALSRARTNNQPVSPERQDEPADEVSPSPSPAPLPSPPPKRKRREAEAQPAKRLNNKAAPASKASTANSKRTPKARGRPRKQAPPSHPETEEEPQDLPENDSSHDQEEPVDWPNSSPSSEEESPVPPARRAPARSRQNPTTNKKSTKPPVRSRTGLSRARSATTPVVAEPSEPPEPESEANPDGLRRSTRHRIRPLEWWRGERAEYGRPSLGNGNDAVVRDIPGPTLRKVYRVNRAEDEGTFSGLRFHKNKRPRTAPVQKQVRRAPPRVQDSATPDPDAARMDDGFVELDPTADNVAVEDGMDEGTERMQLVWDPDSGQEVERLIACTSMQMNPRMPQGQNYGFEKLLSADETLAAGILSVPVGGSKPTKSSKDNNYVCLIIFTEKRRKKHVALAS